jgi:antitoxin PrlF
MAGIPEPKPSEYNVAKCRVDAVLSIDCRGQIVIPKEVRERAKIRDGDKLAPVSWTDRDEICSLSLILADSLSSGAADVMHSLIADKE